MVEQLMRSKKVPDLYIYYCSFCDEEFEGPLRTRMPCAVCAGAGQNTIMQNRGLVSEADDDGDEDPEEKQRKLDDQQSFASTPAEKPPPEEIPADALYRYECLECEYSTESQRNPELVCLVCLNESGKSVKMDQMERIRSKAPQAPPVLKHDEQHAEISQAIEDQGVPEIDEEMTFESLTREISAGEIVMYVMKANEHRPAIVTKVVGVALVNLQVFLDVDDTNPVQQSVLFMRDVLQDNSDDPRLHTWHWRDQLMYGELVSSEPE